MDSADDIRVEPRRMVHISENQFNALQAVVTASRMLSVSSGRKQFEALMNALAELEGT